jgi:hypothetical protein
MKKRHRSHPKVRRPAIADTRKKRAPPDGLERMFTIREIAATGVACPAKLYQDIKAGRLKARKFGRSTRITEGAYRAYIDAAPSL